MSRHIEKLNLTEKDSRLLLGLIEKMKKSKVGAMRFQLPKVQIFIDYSTSEKKVCFWGKISKSLK